MRPPFHLAIPVDDLDKAKEFYINTFGCCQGRSDAKWIDFDFYGHQLVVHLAERSLEPVSNIVDGKDVPGFHFGVVLEWQQWQRLSKRLIELKIDFALAPHIRFQGLVGEQATMFLHDPAGNAIEIKSFKDPAQIFAC